MAKGKFIVIDGTDGTGKGTQTKLLAEKLTKLGKKVILEDFPQYGKKSAGLVEEYLTGVYGSAKQLGPYIPSIFYAADRFAASKRIREYLNKGYTVISNRYVTANMGHQGGKIKSSSERNKYFKWLFDLEYNLFKIPKPDLNLILHIPAKVAQKLVDQKGKREYTKGKKRDIHEKDLKHLEDAEKTYMSISKEFAYPIISCWHNNRLLSIEEVNDLIWKKVKSKL